MYFFSSYIGQYLAQSVLHSLIIVVVVEAIIGLWHVQKPLPQIELRLLALLPAVYLPFYFFLAPSRTGVSFHREIALFDSNAWLGLRLWGGVAVWHLFAGILALTTAYFVVKELVPSLRHYLRRNTSLPPIEEGQFPKLDRVMARLVEGRGLPRPSVFLTSGEAPVVYSLGRRALILSSATLDMLDGDELEAVIAHELAHLSRQTYAVNQLALVLRFLMFYNPVALFVFHRIVDDNEKSCDDIAADATDRRLALASGILRVSRHTQSLGVPATGNASRLSPQAALERLAYNGLLQERIERLAHLRQVDGVPYQGFGVFLTGGLLLALLFFVV